MPSSNHASRLPPSHPGRPYGRAPRGDPLLPRAAVPHGHYKTTTVDRPLRRARGPVRGPVPHGPRAGRSAASAFVGLRHGSRCRLRFAPGDTEVPDNLAAHKVAGVRQAIEAARRTATLPSSLQPGLQSDRARLRHARSPVALGGSPHDAPGPQWTAITRSRRSNDRARAMAVRRVIRRPWNHAAAPARHHASRPSPTRQRL